MGEITEDVRIGLPIDEFQRLWEEHADDVAGAPQDGDGMQWSRPGVRGRVEPTPIDGSTLLHITIEADDPRAELQQMLDRFSDALGESTTITGASFTIDPSAGDAPDEETSSDQPL